MIQHIIESLTAHARKRPDKYGLSDGVFDMDYATIDRFSTGVALELRERGCKAADRVVMVARRSALALAAMLGTFKLNAIHVPLDPHMPAGRLQYILADIAPAFIIADDEIGDIVAAHKNVLRTGELGRLLTEPKARRGSQTAAQSLPAPQLEAPAYCIYTSGSTGRPKGVIIGHRNIAYFFDGLRLVYDVEPESVCASFSTLHFDAFLMDMLFPLTQGACLHLYNDVVEPAQMFGMISARQITHFSAWGTMLGLIARAANFDSTPLPCLKTVLTGADIPDVKVVQRWLRKNDGVKVINGYGPTEATCAAAAHVITELEPERRELYPIGRPLKHVHVLLTDERGERIDTPDTPGELLIGGAQVMKGYWNLPDETATQLTWVEDARYYRTGDICRYLPDGSLFFIGRKDNEVNIGGYRVHLNEVKRVVDSVPAVHGSEIVVLESQYGETILAAAILFDGCIGQRVREQLDLIKHRLIEELPAYMVPRHLAAFDHFPKLSSGKADRKMLATIMQEKMNRRSH